MLEKEKKILQDEYERSLNIVKGSKTHRCFVDEKIAHSLQVFEAGNYLLKNENTFKKLVVKAHQNGTDCRSVPRRRTLSGNR